MAETRKAGARPAFRSKPVLHCLCRQDSAFQRGELVQELLGLRAAFLILGIGEVFPRLLDERLPRYEGIASEYGYSVTSDEVAAVEDEAGFLRLVEQALERGS